MKKKTILAFLLILALAAGMFSAALPALAVSAGWRHNSTGWWYLNEDGSYPAGQWQKIDGIWYYFSDGGYMVTDWQKIDGKWYCFDSSGAMASSEWRGGYWLNRSGSWTYKATGSWHKDSGGWWFGDTSGWYAKNTWQKIDGKWYYFNNAGYMASSEWRGGYWLGKGGAWTYQPVGSWNRGSLGWTFGDSSGWVAKSTWQKISGSWYYFDAAGIMVTGTKVIGGKTCVFDANGVWTGYGTEPASGSDASTLPASSSDA